MLFYVLTYYLLNCLALAAKFHLGLVPKLRALRARYAAAGCAMQMGTVLREPTAQMLSEFLYFRVAMNARLRAASAAEQESELVERWLTRRANPQLAWLRGRKCVTFGVMITDYRHSD